MIIDFRTRPPYKTELNTVIFQDAPECAPEDMSIFDIGKEPIPSKEQKSMELFMRELDESETEQAVIMLSSHFYESRDGSTGGFFADNVQAGQQVWNTVNLLLRLDRRWQI